MKKLLQINYLILVFAVFIVVYRQAFMQRYDKFYFEEGKAILAGENEEYENNKHLFFYEAKGFHQKQSIFQFENEDKTIKIDIYEISYPDHSKTDIHNVVTYLMPIITADESIFKDKEMTYGIYFAGKDDGEIVFSEDNPEEESHVLWFEVINFVNLDIYMADTGYGEIIPTITDQEDDLINIEPVKIEIFSAKSISEDGVNKILIERYLQTDFTITENSFPVRNSLTTLFHEKQANGEPLNITDEDLEFLKIEKEVLFTAFHDASKYNSVLYLWFGIYFLIVIITGYFVFFFKKTNKLGRVKPPKGLEESIKKSEQEKVNNKE